jgi:uncharacterized membrane protein YphA (DoxX/SURF4 family)
MPSRVFLPGSGPSVCQPDGGDPRPFARTVLTVAAIVRSWLTKSDAAVSRDRLATNVAIAGGVIFVFAGLVKFFFHAWELRAFRSFGLPWPAALEILAGVLEIAGGVLLVMRRLVAPVALLLAVTMVVAIAASGIGHGDVIPSLTLAPVLLVAMVFLLVRGLRSD